MQPTETYSRGLEGVVAGETAISTVMEGLRYRGYPIGELVEHASFEEVAYLLLHGELPTPAEFVPFQRRLIEARTLPAAAHELLVAIPAETPPMDALRTVVSVLAHFDPDTNDNSHAANVRKAERLLGQINVAIATQYRLAAKLPPIASRADLSLAGNLLWMIRGTQPTPAEIKAMDVSLILYAEHEFNASTFAARVICSTLADLHSSMVGAIGALKGALHGGANEKVMDILQAIGSLERVDAWMHDAFARKQLVMGFGHRVYKTGDVRAGILKEYARSLAEQAHTSQWETVADRVEAIMATEKNLYPNLDWPAGRLYHALRLSTPLYTPIFVQARVAGWAAHVIEQLDNNRLIRPRARYTGPELRNVTPLAERGSSR
jgi:citrate synthase